MFLILVACGPATTSGGAGGGSQKPLDPNFSGNFTFQRHNHQPGPMYDFTEKGTLVVSATHPEGRYDWRVTGTVQLDEAKTTDPQCACTVSGSLAVFGAFDPQDGKLRWDASTDPNKPVLRYSCSSLKGDTCSGPDWNFSFSSTEFDNNSGCTMRNRVDAYSTNAPFTFSYEYTCDANNRQDDAKITGTWSPQ